MATEIEARLKISAYERTHQAFAKVEARLKKTEALADRLNRRERMLLRSEKAAAVAGAVRAKAVAAERGASEGFLMAGGRLAAGIGGVLAARGVAEAVKDYAALERRMTRVGLAAGATDAETKAATRDLAGYANDFALPFDQAVEGLESLVATGKSLPEAMAFLPSILRTAQAAGAATEDMSASANALATSMKVPASQMQEAFDQLVVGGQLGQFELKDMAQYLPSLTASAAKLGYTGLDGTKKLVAMLQTVRQVSGESSEAATAVGDAIEKTLSPTVAKAFAKRGVNIGKVLEGAAKRGQNQFEAVIDVLDDLSRGMSETERNMLISSIYTDKEARRAVTAMLALRKEYERYQQAIGDSAGATQQNLNRVLDDSQASVDRLSNSWGNLWKSIGRSADVAGATTALEKLAGIINYATDTQEEGLRKSAAVDRALAGLPWVERLAFLATATPEEIDAKARQGGWKPQSVDAIAEGDQRRKDIDAEIARQQKVVAEAEERQGSRLFPYVPGEVEKSRAELDRLQLRRAEIEARNAWDAADRGEQIALPPWMSESAGTDALAPPWMRGTTMPETGPMPRRDPRKKRPYSDAPVPTFAMPEAPVGPAWQAPPSFGPPTGGSSQAGEASVFSPFREPPEIKIGSAGIASLAEAMDTGSASISSAGTEAASSIAGAGSEIGTAISAAANDLRAAGRDAAAAISSAKISVPSIPSAAAAARPNANLGQSAPNAGTPGH